MPLKNCKVGEGTRWFEPVNIYGCQIGRNCMIGPFVEIQDNVIIGDYVRIQSHSFICSKARIADHVFIGHGVIFVNDKYPPRYNEEDWEEIIIETEAVIGSNATILPVTIGRGAMIGAGSVVTHDIPNYTVVKGNPAKAHRLRIPKRK